MAELSTFGAIMSHAIELETKIAQYYRDKGETARAAETDRRRATLERVRRENVVEIQLEPIHGLNAEDYLLDAAIESGDVEAIERTAARFYADVAPKIAAREAARALEKAGKAHRV